MKHLLLFIFTVYSLQTVAQTTLPTSFDFSTAPATMPTGWTTNTTANYGSGLTDLSGGTSRAGKLQSTGHKVTIHFYDEPGELSYFLKSYGTNNFMGTLKVEESTNGTSWTTLTTYGNNDFDNSWTEFNDTPSSSSRYIRFHLTNKVSGTNAGLDNVSLLQNITPEQEMNVVFEDENVPVDTDIQFAEEVSTTLEVKLGIENLGTSDTLHIGNISFSGSAAADYAVGSAPSSVLASSSDTIVVEFTPSQMGNRPATISIANNDANENPYTINLMGVGGLSASEPLSNPSSASTSYLRTWRVNGTFEDVGSDGYIVLMQREQTVSAVPVDGQTYTVGEPIGDAKVVGFGSNPTYRIRSAAAGTEYHISIFAYNGSASLTNYRTSDPLETTVTTPIVSFDTPGYWTGIDETSTNFVSDLQDLINPHSVRFYSNYDEDMVPGFLARDTTNGQEVITGVYSSENVVFSPPFDWSSTNTNREHTLPASWMPTAGNTGTPEYQDFHHLFPTIATANSQRSNRPLGNVVNVTSSYGDGKAGTDASGNSVYEPRDAQKGDAARAIMYMMTAYDWARTELLSNGPNQGLSVLLDWHLNDLPSPFERSRNDYIDSLQGNRNPFVDSAHWVCFIDFKTMTYNENPDSSCLAITGATIPTPADTTDSTIGFFDFASRQDFSIYPNPALESMHIDANLVHYQYQIINMLGETVLFGNGEHATSVNIEALPSGVYTVALTKGEKRFTPKKIVVNQR